jgi:Na+/phosphate symporter
MGEKSPIPPLCKTRKELICIPRKRDNQLILRLNDDELERLNKRVKKLNTTRTEYIRKAIFKKNIINLDGIIDYTKQLSKIGVNINQLAKNSNSGLPVAKNELEKVNKELKELWQLLKEFLRKVQ